MIFSAYFSENGIPKEELNPLISIYNVTDGTLVVDDEPMIEVAKGFYKYEYTEIKRGKEYTSICDSVSLLGNERYAVGQVESTHFDIKRLLGLIHENMYIDCPVYDKDGNLKEARIRTYSDKDSVGTDENVIMTYKVTADTTGPGKFNTWKQVIFEE